MYSILTLNKIAACGTDKFGGNYTCSSDVKDPTAIMVRSASMHEMELSDATIAIARAGAGTNNIPVEACAEKGVVVFNTPGANANAVKELVICGLLMASRKVGAAIDWCKTLKGEGEAVGKLVEKGKSNFAGPEIGGKTLAIFLSTTAIAVAIGLVFANVMNIGGGFTMPAEVSYDAKEVPSVVDTLLGIIPTNPFNALSTQNLLQIIFFSLLLGFSLIGLGEKGAPVLNFFRAWTEAWKEITNIVLKFTPYGVFGLMANIVGKYGLDVMLPYIKTIAACYITCALFTIFVQGFLMAGLYCGISPKKFFGTMKEAMLFVFATCSSVATISCIWFPLKMTMRVLSRKSSSWGKSSTFSLAYAIPEHGFPTVNFSLWGGTERWSPCPGNTALRERSGWKLRTCMVRH